MVRYEEEEEEIFVSSIRKVLFLEQVENLEIEMVGDFQNQIKKGFWLD